MRAIGITEFGGNDKLKVLEVAKPTAGAGELLIKVVAAGVNPVDYKIREGYLQKALPHAFPLVLGWDCAGTVEEVGSGVRGFKAGDAVFAYCRKPTVQWGSFAEYIAVPAENAAPKPKLLSFAEAATVPLAALTAWQMLFDVAKLMPGQSVLVHAAAGGVGGYGVEFAHWRKAESIATAQTHNHEYVRNLGARRIVDYQVQDFRTACREAYPNGVDVVLDCVGGETLKRSAEVVKKGGVIVSIVDQTDAKALGRTDITFAYHFVQPNQKQLTDIGHLIDEKYVTPHLTKELPLDQAGKALEMMHDGHTRGKVALQILRH